MEQADQQENRDERLRQALRQLRGSRPAPPNLQPGSTYEALLDQRIRDLDRAIAEIRARVNALFFAIIAAVVIDILIRLLN